MSTPIKFNSVKELESFNRYIQPNFSFESHFFDTIANNILIEIRTILVKELMKSYFVAKKTIMLKFTENQILILLGFFNTHHSDDGIIIVLQERFKNTETIKQYHKSMLPWH